MDATNSSHSRVKIDNKQVRITWKHECIDAVIEARKVKLLQVKFSQVLLSQPLDGSDNIISIFSIFTPLTFHL